MSLEATGYPLEAPYDGARAPVAPPISLVQVQLAERPRVDSAVESEPLARHQGSDSSDSEAMPDPADPRGRTRAAIELSRRGLHESAIVQFAEAVRLRPTNHRAWYNLGAAHQACGRLLTAARYYQVSLLILPDYEHARLALQRIEDASPGLSLPRLAPPPDVAPYSTSEPGAGIAALRADRTLHWQTGAWPLIVAELEQLPWTSAVSPLARLSEGVTAVLRPSQPGAAPIAAAHLPQRLPCRWTRLAATLTDLAVIQVLWLLLIMALNAARLYLPGSPEAPAWTPLVLGPVTALLYLVMLTAASGQTIGKQLVRVRVVDHEGHAPSTRRALVRTATTLLHVGTLGLAPSRVTAGGLYHAVHDRISSTYVVGRRLDPSTAFVLNAMLLAANLYLLAFLRFQLV